MRDKITTDQIETEGNDLIIRIRVDHERDKAQSRWLNFIHRVNLRGEKAGFGHTFTEPTKTFTNADGEHVEHYPTALLIDAKIEGADTEDGDGSYVLFRTGHPMTATLFRTAFEELCDQPEPAFYEWGSGEGHQLTCARCGALYAGEPQGPEEDFCEDCWDKPEPKPEPTVVEQLEGDARREFHYDSKCFGIHYRDDREIEETAQALTRATNFTSIHQLEQRLPGCTATQKAILLDHLRDAARSLIKAQDEFERLSKLSDS